MAEEKASTIKVRKPPVKPRTFTFTLSLPALISGIGSGLLALSFFFVMGILIGRGYRPEADVPRLSELMPAKEHGQASAQEKPEILKAEELGYPDRLKADPDKIMASSGSPEVQPAPAKKTAPAKPEPAKPEPAKPAAKSEPAAQPAPVQPGEPVFDYVYQVASFRKVEMAQGLADKLSGAGLNAVVASGDVKGSTWHRVQVLYQGTPASTASMKAVLAKSGIQRPLLKKKTPVQ